MEKMKLHSPDLTQANIEKIRALFPDCVTEVRDEETDALHLAVDFDQLRQELSNHIVEGPRERYQLDWPGKREAKIVANAPIAKTLRPCREESVNFDATKNLFIEGDNLDALKLLRETYLAKVKLIYIDPPYNTGSDFLYDDDFAETTADFLARSNQTDEDGNRLVANTDSNGRFHSDWLTFIYPRLKLAKNLLDDDGFIFISIDDNEIHNLKKICDEIFGQQNFIGQITVQCNPSGRDYGGIARMHDYLLAYQKSDDAEIYGLVDHNKEFPFTDEISGFEIRELRNRNITFHQGNRPNLHYPFYLNPDNVDENGFCEISLESKSGFIEILPKESQGYKTVWRWGKSKSAQNLNINIVGKPMKDGGYQIVEKYRKKSKMARSIWNDKDVYTEKGTLLVKSLFDKKIHDFPKPVEMIMRIVEMSSKENDVILDFFAGSSTTAHAVMKFNAKYGGNRKFIMVQLPEECAPESTAVQEGYATIADFSKERIRRAGAKILEGECHKDWQQDIGFRVLKIDDSNRKDIKREPNETEQAELLESVDNFKPDRTGEDLLFEVLVNWGVDLTLPIRRETHNGKTIYFVDDNALIACFDKIDEDLVKTFIAHKPVRVVFRDSSFADDAMKANIEQFFLQKSPDTEIKVI